MTEAKVINSPASGSKKGEGKKRKSPFTPIEKKARSKKLNLVFVAQVYRARVRVDCVPSIQSSSQSGFIDKPISSQSTPARVRMREGLPPIADPAVYFKAWREAKWGGDFDPVRVAVDGERPDSRSPLFTKS